jgi:pyrroloquinoline quinone (PQQ) biosynthesis protein C
MTREFQLTGDLKLLGSYPTWAQDMVTDCQADKQSVLNHPIWQQMCNGTINKVATRSFMSALWPVIEGFPKFMAMSLLKTRFGICEGENMARRWLVRNIRVEQNHAEYWLDWAEGSGVSRDEVLHGRDESGRSILPAGWEGLPTWCKDVCTRDDLASGMIATNYAIEGVTGEWAHLVFNSETYQGSVQKDKTTLKWLRLHAQYDDEHPWEALEIVCALLGNNPSRVQIEHLKECVQRSYRLMRILGDICIRSGEQAEADDRLELAAA